MKRNFLDVPRWRLYQFRRVLGLPFADSLDSRDQRLADELFGILYGDARELPEKSADKRDAAFSKSALTLIQSVSSLDWERAKKECRGDVARSAEVAKAALDALPKAPSQAPQSAREAADGLSNVDMDGDDGEGGSGSKWTGKWQGETEENKRAAELAEKLAGDERLKRIAALAGKFKRVALSTERRRVKRGADEITDVVQGSAIERLLPTELLRIASSRYRLAALRDLTERKCLEYEMTSIEAQGRGPVVLCVDKSPSMEGDKDIWATAVALALAESVHRQRRTFVLLFFNHEVFHRKVVKPGRPFPEASLFVPTSGGTDVGKVLDLALHAAESKAVMRRADVIVVTDGESDTSTAGWIRQRAERGGVRIYGIAIDNPAEVLEPWCDEVHAIEDVSGMDDETSGILFGK